MKHLIKTIVVVAAVLLAAGCNKETLPTPQPADQTRHVGYVKCGEPGNATVTGEEAWHALLDTLFDATLEGCAITLWDADLAGAQQAKETVTYSTASRDSAYAWGERMYNQGYAVSVIYDPQTHQYNCSAAKLTHQPETIIRNVGYMICGGESIRTLSTEGEWISFLDGVFNAAENGCGIFFWNSDLSVIQPGTKVIPDYLTSTRDSAISWAERVYTMGQVFFMRYDMNTGIYKCGAHILATANPNYSPVQLSNYLSNTTWIMDNFAYFTLTESGFQTHPFYEQSYFQADTICDSLIFTLDSLYSHGRVLHTHAYTITSNDNIMLGNSQSDMHRVIQLDSDRMLVQGIQNETHFVFPYYDNNNDIWLMFKRVN